MSIAIATDPLVIVAFVLSPKIIYCFLVFVVVAIALLMSDSCRNALDFKITLSKDNQHKDILGNIMIKQNGIESLRLLGGE